MTDIVWPADLLPEASLDDYELQHVDTLLVTDFVSGDDRSRNLYLNAPTDVPVSWLMTNREFRFFEGWYRHVLQNGARWFSMVLKTSVGIADTEVKFRGIYLPRAVGGARWRVTATVRMRSRQTIDEAATIGYLAGADGDLAAYNAAFLSILQSYYTRSWES